MNKINYFKEKKWIMAWWFEKKGDVTESQMLNQWRLWWKTDFDSITDQRFQDAFHWVKETITKTKEEIHKGRYDIANYRPVPTYLQELALHKGYYIKKSNVKKKPLNVSGYAIYKKGSKKKPIYGLKFDLTINQVKKYLQ